MMLKRVALGRWGVLVLVCDWVGFGPLGVHVHVLVHVNVVRDPRGIR